MFFPYKDDNPRVLVPYMNYGIIGLNVFIFTGQIMLSLHDPRVNIALINVFGFIPIEFNLLDILTSMFMHGGLFHILGNMWFLWIFGDNVESALGHVRYLGFYLFCGFGAAIGQFLINPSSPVPMVGASGAIAGILGAYMLMYPRARVHVLIIFFVITTIAVPARSTIPYAPNAQWDSGSAQTRSAIWKLPLCNGAARLSQSLYVACARKRGRRSPHRLPSCARKFTPR